MLPWYWHWRNNYHPLQFSSQSWWHHWGSFATLLFWPKLLFYSPVWKSYLLKHTQILERLQRWATKYILNDYHTDYKTHLIHLILLRITYTLDMVDIMLFIKSIKNPTNNFNILDYVSFSNDLTRSSNCKLNHTFMSSNQSRNFYCNRISSIRTPYHAVNDLSTPVLTTKHKIKIFMWNHFTTHFDPDDICSFNFLWYFLKYL